MPIYKDLYTQDVLPLSTPFENIALAFSGGGFRAASFSIGVLSYYESVSMPDIDEGADKTLLEHVKYISSASGGTITNAMYALHKANGEDFNTYYKAQYEAMDGDELLSSAIDNLNHKGLWRKGHKTRNFINSFAISYDSPLLFNKATLKDLAEPKHKTHLEEVCFNSTEFFTGLPFRQQVKMQERVGDDDRHFFYGNRNVYVDGDVVKKLKLADILAASSCFPAGYEPIEFPTDFCHDCLTPDMLRAQLKMEPQKDDKRERSFIKAGNVGLMDGGITDNQGLESLMEADERRRARKDRENATNFQPFDLIMVNDVGSFFMSPYVVPPMKNGRADVLTLNMIIILLVALMVSGIALFHHGYEYGNHMWYEVVGSIFAILPAVVLIPIYIIHFNLKVERNRKALNLHNTFSQAILNKLIRFMRRTPLGLLKEVNKTRFNSVMILTSDVFMKRIRQILFESFYHHPIWMNRRKGNHIYDLSISGNMNRDRRDKDAPKPELPIQIVAETACIMGTTLWFDKESRTVKHSMACIIACGEFTTCYNLIDYITKLRVPELWNGFSKAYQDRINIIDKQLHEDWARFQKDPFFRFNERGKAIWGEAFIPVDHKKIPYPEHRDDRVPYGDN